MLIWWALELKWWPQSLNSLIPKAKRIHGRKSKTITAQLQRQSFQQVTKGDILPQESINRQSRKALLSPPLKALWGLQPRQEQPMRRRDTLTLQSEGKLLWDTASSSTDPQCSLFFKKLRRTKLLFKLFKSWLISSTASKLISSQSLCTNQSRIVSLRLCSSLLALRLICSR